MNGLTSPWPIFAAFVAIAVIAMVVSSVRAGRRRKELAALATRLGFAFTPDVATSRDEAFDGFTPFGRGRSQRASNQIVGWRGGVKWEMFDYRYVTGSGKSRSTHRYGIIAARVTLSFPRVTIRPEGMADQIASLAGFDDINFESEAFSRRYHVKADDRGRVYDLIHPGMMEYLLSLPNAHWQFGDDLVLLVRTGSYGVEELGRAMGMIEGFLGRVPGYVRADLSHTSP